MWKKGSFQCQLYCLILVRALRHCARSEQRAAPYFSWYKMGTTRCEFMQCIIQNSLFKIHQKGLKDSYQAYDESERKNFILVAPFLSNFEFKFLLHYALLCCTMYYSIQYSTQVEHTVGVAARVRPHREQYVVVHQCLHKTGCNFA